MAVAVKNVPEATTRKPVNRLALGSLAGAVYLIAAVGVVFYGVPALWWGLIEWLNLDLNEFVAGALLVPLVLAAGVGAVVLGWRLLGPAPVHGLRAGVFFTLAGLLAIAQVTSWVGSWLETRELDETISIVITLAAAAGLLYLGARLLFSPRFGAWLGRVEDQGWFTATPYKPNQGLRVRRGTIIALVALAGCGIYTMLAHRSLARAGDWFLPIPFTSGVDGYWAVTLLPHLRYTVPLLLLAAMIWVAWRIVNWPVFADFLIATEAEMNKVSWTTRRRLVQDTAVVLVTVILLTVFLFAVDVLWIKLLSNPIFRVLQIDPMVEKQKMSEHSQW